MNFGEDFGVNFWEDFLVNFEEDFGVNFREDFVVNFGEDFEMNFEEDFLATECISNIMHSVEKKILLEIHFEILSLEFRNPP